MRGRPTIDDDGRQKRVDRSRSRIPLWASSSCCLSILFRSIDRGDTFARFDERTKQLKAPRARVMRRCDDASLLRSGARSSRRRRSPDWQRRSRSSPSRSCRRFALESPCWIDDASSRTHVGSAIPIRGGASAVLERREEKKNELSFAIAHSLSLSLSLARSPPSTSTFPLKKNKKKSSSRPTRPPSSRRSSRTSRSRTGRSRSGSASARATRSGTTPSAATGGAPSSGSRGERERERKKKKRGRVFFLCSPFFPASAFAFPSARFSFDKCVTFGSAHPTEMF